MITILHGYTEDRMLLQEANSIEFATDQETAVVTLLHGTEQLFTQEFFPNLKGQIYLTNLADIFQHTLREKLIDTYTLEIKDAATTLTKEFTLLYCQASIWLSFDVFTSHKFLSNLQGFKTIASNQVEWLHLYIVELTTVRASIETIVDGVLVYSAQDLAILTPDNTVHTIDVSPELLNYEGELVSYTIIAGERKQIFKIDPELDATTSAPALLFTNSFGCQESLYCYGTQTLKPAYERSPAIIRNFKRNYYISEERIFSANTGDVSPEHALWIDDLFRSTEVYLLNGRVPGHEIVITDSDSTRSNALDAMTAFSFEYTYATRKQNMLTTPSAGRVFDNTFDKTFG